METDNAIKEAVKDINTGVGFGIFSVVMSIVVLGVSLYVGNDTPVLDVFSALEILLMGGCLYGIYRKSRIASTLFLADFIIARIYLLTLIAEKGKSPSMFAIIAAFVFGYVYIKAMLGTYKYHQLVNLPPDENTLQT